MILGSHLSIAGGPHKALQRAAEYGFATVAIFVRNQRRWRAPRLGQEAVASFRRARRRLGIRPVVAHGSYLINLAGSAPVRRRSITAVAKELDRCGRLGVEFYVLHPGSPGRAGRERGIARVADALSDAIARSRRRRVKVLLETTAGAGQTLGGSFEDLAEILARLDRPGRFGICLDTCHVFAAGYDLRAPRAYRETMDRLEAVVGLDRLKCVHLNDSACPLGSRRDRHAHVGKGEIGLAGFSNVVNDARLGEVPMILETPKGRDDAGRDYDLINAEAIRALTQRQ
jgi:deoxyribonuclease-4